MYALNEEDIEEASEEYEEKLLENIEYEHEELTNQESDHQIKLYLKEIGKVLRVTESRVSQLHAQAISRLRSKLTQVFEDQEQEAS